MKLLLAVARLVLVLVLVSLQWENRCVSGSESISCREEERSALLQINATLPVPIQSSDGKWEGMECCRWERVTCDPNTGHVTKLDLSANEMPLQGILLNASMFLPLRQLRSLSLARRAISGCMVGAGLETWSNLTKLEILDLAANNVERSIMYDLASVSSLRTLDLTSNGIGISDLPINGFESWSNLTKLEMLDLSLNDLPTKIISSLAHVSSLRALYLDYSLDYSMMGGNVPVKELSALNLEAISLSGCMLSGSIPYFGHWSSLKALSLEDNSLNGTLTSAGLCRLENLEELDLSWNNFTGNLPPCMENLSSLKLVDLSHNQFQIRFPSIFERFIYLVYLSLSDNLLEGTLSMRSFLNHSNLEVLGLSTRSSSFRVEVVNMSFQLQELELANTILEVEPTFLYSQYKLRALDLSNTRSKGPLSTVWLLLVNNKNLIKLDLHKNFFTGPLHLPFLTHENLVILDISDNHLGGELPANITTKLPNLLFLSLSKNNFQGPLPLMPTRDLHSLNVSSNNLTDDIHNSFSRIQLHDFSILDLSNNNFYGSFIKSFNFTQVANRFTGVTKLMLNDNNISGEIPSVICNTSFDVLDLSNNELNGDLPDCIGSARYQIGSLALKLSGNNLEGSLPLEMCDVPNRWLLDLSNNKFSGSIPPCSNQSSLQIVDLSQNYLTGNFPITWLNISDIYAINIQENQLSGELPSWIGKESTLRLLQARENLIGGPIPEQICQFKYLRILDLSHNNLSGQIPLCIIDMGSTTGHSTFLDIEEGSYVSDMTALNFSDANFLLPFITDYVELGYDDPKNFGLKLVSKGRSDFFLKEILLIMCLIDLSSNKLVGNIPEDIGRMNWLITLNLSNNHFSGAIPDSISNLHQLESLDLSHNSLTGEIPRELTKLTSLGSFSVAYNDLSGPTLGVEAQFGTFDNSSYEGNPNLCGPPLSKSCDPTIGTTQPSPDEMSDHQRYEGTNFIILFGSFSLFFVVSFWGFMTVLYFKRNWRYGLFTLIDRYGDMIYVKVVLSARLIGVVRTQRGN